MALHSCLQQPRSGTNIIHPALPCPAPCPGHPHLRVEQAGGAIAGQSAAHDDVQFVHAITFA